MKLASFISPKDLYVKCFDHRKPWDLLRPEILLGKQCPNSVLGPKLITSVRFRDISRYLNSILSLQLLSSIQLSVLRALNKIRVESFEL